MNLSTGQLRSQCEQRSNNDDQMLELIERGYSLKWNRAGKLSLYKDGQPTHGPDRVLEVGSPVLRNDRTPGKILEWIAGRANVSLLNGKETVALEPHEMTPACKRCEGYGGIAWDATGGMSVSCPDCDESGRAT